MSRQKRITLSGCVHHIMARGLDGTAIFCDDTDRLYFIDHLGNHLTDFNFRCYAWALLTNHYHILVRTSSEPLGDCMRKLNTGYARYFNRKYRRRGYLFQDRYKSTISQEQKYFEELVRYIHLNPVRAGIVKTMEELDTFRWSGHALLMGTYTCNWYQDGEVLSRFGGDRESALNNYRLFIKEGMNGKNDEDFWKKVLRFEQRLKDIGTPNRDDVRLRQEGIIGDRDFIKSVLREEQRKNSARKIVRQYGITLDVLAERVGSFFGLAKGDLLHRASGNKRSHARDVLAYMAQKELGVSYMEIGDYMSISSSAVSHMTVRGRRYVEESDNDLKSFFNGAFKHSSPS